MPPLLPPLPPSFSPAVRPTQIAFGMLLGWMLRRKREAHIGVESQPAPPEH